MNFIEIYFDIMMSILVELSRVCKKAAKIKAKLYNGLIIELTLGEINKYFMLKT